MKDTIGQRIIQLRKEKGLTQEEVANKVGVSPQAVSKWENDISAPDIMLLEDLANLFKVSIDELLGRKKEIEVVVANKRKDINSMFLRIAIESKDEDKVRINIPVQILKIAIETGIQMPQINGNSALKNVDFKQIFMMIEQGVIGRLLEIESKDGDLIYISVE